MRNDEPILEKCRVAQKDAPINHRFNDMPTRNLHRILVYPLLGLFWLAVTTVTAQEVRFEQVTVDDGLSNNGITAVLEDSRGYLWVGTRQGLNRYDGYGVRVYQHIPGDTTSLSDDWIFRLHEGRDGMLWVGTWGGGLNRLTPIQKSSPRTGTGKAMPPA